MQRHRNVVVVDGRVGLVVSESHAPEDRSVEFDTFSGYVHFVGTLGSLLARAVRLRQPSLRHWAAASAGSAYAELDRPGLTPSAIIADRVDAFVYDRLIPFLKDLRHQRPERKRPPAAAALEPSLVPELDDRFAFIAERWYQLVPFFGSSGRGSFVFRLQDQQFIGLRTESTRAAVGRYDSLLRDAVCAALPSHQIGSREHCDLYHDDRYSVIRTPGGRHFLSYRLPPYVIEGVDRKLYHFDGAEIGIAITSIDVRQVITSQAVQVLHAYRHMFVSFMGNGHFVCMPRGLPYFNELYRLPLEEALLRHLESGRLTLCAGYQPSNAVLHPIQATGRRTISLNEARKRSLPVYWYDRPRRGIRSKVMSMFA